MIFRLFLPVGAAPTTLSPSLQFASALLALSLCACITGAGSGPEGAGTEVVSSSHDGAPEQAAPAGEAPREGGADATGSPSPAELRDESLPARRPGAQPRLRASELAAGPSPRSGGTAQLGPPPEGLAVATFGGGCFWCVEADLQPVEGVEIAVSGYTGGPEVAPLYREVVRGETGHVEAGAIFFDPEQVTYEELLRIYWRNIDPTDDQGQFADRGLHYRPVIFVHDEAQRLAAHASRERIEASGLFSGPIVVAIEEAGPFWIAEEEHQNYYLERPQAYERYRRGSGRASFVERIWGERR